MDPLFLIGGGVALLALITGKKKKPAPAPEPEPEIIPEPEPEPKKSNNAAPVVPVQDNHSQTAISHVFPLKEGSRGDQVKVVQVALNNKFKAGLQPDGIWGKLTTAALKKFTGKTSLNETEYRSQIIPLVITTTASSSAVGKTLKAKLTANILLKSDARKIIRTVKPGGIVARNVSAANGAWYIWKENGVELMTHSGGVEILSGLNGSNML